MARFKYENLRFMIPEDKLMNARVYGSGVIDRERDNRQRRKLGKRNSVGMVCEYTIKILTELMSQSEALAVVAGALSDTDCKTSGLLNNFKTRNTEVMANQP